MTNLEIAQKIADKIDAHSQEEIDAMMDIVCEVNGIDRGWMFRAVSNLYMRSESYKPAAICNTQSYSEIEAR